MSDVLRAGDLTPAVCSRAILLAHMQAVQRQDVTEAISTLHQYFDLAGAVIQAHSETGLTLSFDPAEGDGCGVDEVLYL